MIVTPIFALPLDCITVAGLVNEASFASCRRRSRRSLLLLIIFYGFLETPKGPSRFILISIPLVPPLA